MPDTSQRDERLERILADYLHAIEDGNAPDRAALLNQYPELAADLTSFFRNRDAMQRMAAPIKEQLPALAETIGGADSPKAGSVIRYFGDYELLEEIARGGMGVVYRARQKSLNRVVAVKMILSGQLASAADVARFQSEAEAAANLDHPNILPIFEVGKHEEQQYFSMKLIEGGSLATRVAELVARPRDGAALVARLARAVHYAHQRGILHRDLKPANVLLDPDGTPYITDFGLAKRTEEESGLTRTGAVVGTPSYMPPEQARAEKQVTTAADVYALGAILYELLTGRPPFRAGTVHNTIQQVLEKEPDHPRTFNPGAHRDLSAIALKCLQKAPENRYESAAALADDIDRWLDGEPTHARPPSLVGQAWRWLRRNTAAALGIAVLGTVGGMMPVLIMFALQGINQAYIYPQHMAFLNPLRVIQFTSHNPAGQIGLAVMSLILAFGLGWFVKWISRAKTMQAALTAAATTAVIATLSTFSVVGPGGGSDVQYMTELRLHPLSVPPRAGVRTLTPADAAYLKQYLPPDPPPEGSGNYINMMGELQARAENTNQVYAAIIVGWCCLGFCLIFYLGLCLVSTGAADYVSRSGRGTLAQAICYLELYPPAALLLLWSLVMVGMAITLIRGNITGGPNWLQLLTPLAFGAAWVGLAYTGVIRRWHPALRLVSYVVTVGLGVLVIYCIS